ncbi:Importin-5 [Ancistrocladus abbreviatus]
MFICQISGPLLDESQVRSIVDEIKQVITASSSRKRERGDRAKAEDFDAEEGELLKEENEQEEELFEQIGDCLGTLIKTFKASFLPFFDELSTYLTPMWGKDKTAEERRIAICIFDDVLEQCREAALKYYDTYLYHLLDACSDENPDVRQAAVFGLGVCAEYGGSVFRPVVGDALSRLNAIIRHPNSTHPENLMAYDNAVSALGKICQFHRDSIDAAQAIPLWLNCLPIRGDLIEAKVVHEQLCSMLERSDGELLGPNNQYLPKIVAVFAEVLCAGKDSSNRANCKSNDQFVEAASANVATFNPRINLVIPATTAAARLAVNSVILSLTIPWLAHAASSLWGSTPPCSSHFCCIASILFLVMGRFHSAMLHCLGGRCVIGEVRRPERRNEVFDAYSVYITSGSERGAKS